ncbi:MAG: branched-chain amino acid ABC transporter substrate-binding protein [Betaproteobacteria bacterium]|nr:branched-chain amino acid ABC transporter substrate-binding protein [Betaproteobacteria bacterium]
MPPIKKFAQLSWIMVALLSVTGLVLAEKKYGPGVTDSDIKLGQTMPYSGTASPYGVIGKTQLAYFKMLNEQGGINGRKVNLISLDDGYSPPRTVEQVRRLVEEEQVLALFQTLGTPTNSAIHKYVNAKKVPHLFVSSGATKWGDPKNFPWTMGFNPSYQIESRIYAKYILKHKPDAKIAVLYQNDDSGKDYLKGFRDGLGAKANMIVAEASYEATDATVDSQIISLKASGANVMFTHATPKFAAQSIRKVADTGWKPLHFLVNVASSVGATLVPAGLDKSVGLITALYLKDPTDTLWAADPGMKRWREFMSKYMAGADQTDSLYVWGYGAAQIMAHVLRACGDDLSRENLMKQATSIKDVTLDVTLPGIKLNTGPDDYFLIEQLQPAQFDGKRWVLFSEVMGHE